MWALVCVSISLFKTRSEFSPQDVKCADLFLSLRAYSLYDVKKKKKKVTVCVHACFSVPLHKSVGRERPAHPRRGRFGEALICTIQSCFFFFWGETERKMDVLMKWLKDYLLTCCVLYVNFGLWDRHAGGKRQIMDQSEKVPYYSHFQIYFMNLLWNSFAFLIRQQTPYSRAHRTHY